MTNTVVFEPSEVSSCMNTSKRGGSNVESRSSIRRGDPEDYFVVSVEVVVVI